MFISFEGGEGSGKSTQANVLVDRLAELGHVVEFVHEPGSTELGWRVRDIVKRGLDGEGGVCERAELLLFAAARAELVYKRLLPLLADPDVVVVADRYVDSTTAYQGYGRGIQLGQIEVVNSLATQGVMPDLTFLLDIDPVEGLTRIGGLQLGFRMGDGALGWDAARAQEGARFEDEPLGFHERVLSGYLKLAKREPHRFCVIDAAQSRSRVSELVWKEVCGRFPKLADFKEDGER